MKEEHEIQVALDHYSDMIRRICFLHLKNHFDVEDVFQEVFLKYALYTKPFENHEHEKAWFIRVSINACKDLLRNVFRRRTVSLDQLIAQPSQIEGDHKDILNAIAKLPEKHRIVIYMVYYEGYSVVETAEVLGRKENTVYSWLTRARKQLRAELGGDENGS